MWVNNNTKECTNQRPVRVRLDDGSTRTQEEVTDEVLIQAGWVLVPDLPIPGEHNVT